MPFERDILKREPPFVDRRIWMDKGGSKEGAETRKQERQVRQAWILDLKLVQ